MNILGVSAFYHDSAACIVRDGAIVAAAQEERFTRKKHDPGFPHHAIQYCLKEAGLTAAKELDLVAFYEKPFSKLDRLFSSYLATAPSGLVSFLKATPVWIKEKIWIKQILRDNLGFEGAIIFPEHHESHAASAFFPSSFKEAAILTIDGVGEWATTTVGHGTGNRVRLLKEVRFPHSIGLLYSAFTSYLGFRVNSGEYKVMGLAPYGKPRFRDVILTELVDLKEDGSFQLNLEHFNFIAGLTMTNRSFDQLFGGHKRQPEGEITQRHVDIARSIQSVTEEAMVRMSRYVHRLTGSSNLCLAGGVALNCVGNGAILRDGVFEKMWIQPAAGDAGGALGAALIGWYHYADQMRKPPDDGDFQKGSLLGPSYDPSEFLEGHAHIFGTELSENDLIARVADLLADGEVIGWYQGRMEFGPRALGNRSILADPRLQTMQATLNQKIKFRESFRPFAPAVLRERAKDYFDLDHESPYMLLVGHVISSSSPTGGTVSNRIDIAHRLKAVCSAIPAVTHVDHSARVQTVGAGENPLFYRLLCEFEQRTGCAVLVNTSFNVRGEPPVCTPAEAFNCFARTSMDHLVMGNFLIGKRDQQIESVILASKAERRLGTDSDSNASRFALLRFGFTVGVAFIAVAIVLAIKHRFAAWPFGALGVILIIVAQAAPMILQYFHRAWTALSLVIGWVMTRLILTIVFSLVVTPIGLLHRFLGKRAFELDFPSDSETCWEPREREFVKRDYENQF